MHRLGADNRKIRETQRTRHWVVPPAPGRFRPGDSALVGSDPVDRPRQDLGLRPGPESARCPCHEPAPCRVPPNGIPTGPALVGHRSAHAALGQPTRRGSRAHPGTRAKAGTHPLGQVFRRRSQRSDPTGASRRAGCPAGVPSAECPSRRTLEPADSTPSNGDHGWTSQGESAFGRHILAKDGKGHRDAGRACRYRWGDLAGTSHR